MTKKKITIPNTPNRGALDKAIDNWVTGGSKNHNSIELKNDDLKKPQYARTTFQIPTGLYKKLKKIALIEDKSITQKLTEILENNLPDV
jgi:hypothetical protein